MISVLSTIHTAVKYGKEVWLVLYENILINNKLFRQSKIFSKISHLI